MGKNIEVEAMLWPILKEISKNGPCFASVICASIPTLCNLDEEDKKKRDKGGQQIYVVNAKKALNCLATAGLISTPNGNHYKIHNSALELCSDPSRTTLTFRDLCRISPTFPDYMKTNGYQFSDSIMPEKNKPTPKSFDDTSAVSTTVEKKPDAICGNGPMKGIYVASNSSMPNYLRIAYSSDIAAELASISKYLPTPSKLEIVYLSNENVSNKDISNLISKLSGQPAQARLDEYFSISLDEAKQIFTLLTRLTGTKDKLFVGAYAISKILNSEPTKQVEEKPQEIIKKPVVADPSIELAHTPIVTPNNLDKSKDKARNARLAREYPLSWMIEHELLSTGQEICIDSNSQHKAILVGGEQVIHNNRFMTITRFVEMYKGKNADPYVETSTTGERITLYEIREQYMNSHNIK